MTGLSVVCLTALVLVQSVLVQGSCFADQAYFDVNTGEVYCMVENLKLDLGQWYLTPDCFNCTCGFDSLSCCGVGIRAGAIAGPPLGYEIQMIPPCDFIIVPKT